MKRPIIAVVVPATDMVWTGFGMSLAWMCVQAAKDFDVRVIHSKSSNVAIVRNNGVAGAKMHRAEWILWLDSDQTFPRDTLHRLMAHEKDIVGATYPMRTAPFMMLGVATKDEDSNKQEGLIQMEHMPAGCLLMKMDVFKNMDRPYFRCPFDEFRITGEDVDFCERAREAGYTIWNDIDLSKEIGHIGAKEFRYDSPEVQKTMNDHVQEQAEAALPPISISVLLPSRGRPELLKMAVMAMDHLSSEINKITYCIGVDADDAGTMEAAHSLAQNINVSIITNDRPGGIGKFYNDMAKKNPADAYLTWADDILPLAQNWDINIAKGVEQFPIFAWHDFFNGKAPTYPVISKKWYEAAGCIYTEYFPFWFNDTWLNEIVTMVTGKPIPIATDMPLGGRRGSTMRMRDLGVWVDFFREMRQERMIEADAIIANLGVPKPSPSKMSLGFEQNDVFLASNAERFEHTFGDNEPPTPEYEQALAFAKAKLNEWNQDAREKFYRKSVPILEESLKASAK